MFNLDLSEKRGTYIDSNYTLINKQEISETTHIPVYENSTSNNFHVVPISTLSAERVQEYSRKKAEILRDFNETDNFLCLELNWDYEGKKITTLSIISEESQGIIYDDILSNIRFITIDSSSTMTQTQLADNSHNQSLLISCGDEMCDNHDCQGPGCDDYLCSSCVCAEGMADGPVSFYESKSIGSRNWLNNVSAEASFWLRVTGERYDGVVEVQDYEKDAYYWCEPGFSADAMVDVSHFEPGQNGFVEYEYALMTGSQPGLMIEIVAGSWTIPSGAHGSIGGGVVRDDELE